MAKKDDTLPPSVIRLQPLAHEWMPNEASPSSTADYVVKRCVCGHVVRVKRAPGWYSKQAKLCNEHIRKTVTQV